MNLLVNPVVLRMGLLLLVGGAAFGLGLFVIRRLRKNLDQESQSLGHSPLAAEGLPVHAYHAVIQQLKQQKHELTTQQLSDRRKAKASDTLSSTILSNLSCGVLFLNTSGLVRQANAGSAQIAGIRFARRDCMPPIFFAPPRCARGTRFEFRRQQSSKLWLPLWQESRRFAGWCSTTSRATEKAEYSK